MLTYVTIIKCVTIFVTFIHVNAKTFTFHGSTFITGSSLASGNGVPLRSIV